MTGGYLLHEGLRNVFRWSFSLFLIRAPGERTLLSSGTFPACINPFAEYLPGPLSLSLTIIPVVQYEPSRRYKGSAPSSRRDFFGPSYLAFSPPRVRINPSLTSTFFFFFWKPWERFQILAGLGTSTARAIAFVFKLRTPRLADFRPTLTRPSPSEIFLESKISARRSFLDY